MTMRDELLEEIDDPDDRRTVAALTDIKQTHLSPRDWRRLGGGGRGE